MNSAAVRRSQTSTGMVFYARGEGPPLVLLHGWCLNRKLWLYAEEAFAADCRVVTPDLPVLACRTICPDRIRSRAMARR